MIRLLVLVYLILLISCSISDQLSEDDTYLHLYMNTELIEDLYIVKFDSLKDHSYTSVYYHTLAGLYPLEIPSLAGGIKPGY